MNESLVGKYMLVCEAKYHKEWVDSDDSGLYEGLMCCTVEAFKIVGYLGDSTAICEQLWLAILPRQEWE